MPATYAAVTASLNALCESVRILRRKACSTSAPGRAPRAGPRRKHSPRCRSLTLLDANDALRSAGAGSCGDSSRLRRCGYERGDARAALAEADAADLVVASYVIGEIGEAERSALAERCGQKTRDTLLVVEPGTPAGYARIIALRQQLIAAGAHVAAPCPHDGNCPLAAPDWCHFTQRLPRSRAHKQIKAAELPFEDEKFSYVALTRAPAGAASLARAGAACRQQGRGDGETLHAGWSRNRKSAASRQDDYARARRWRWGDAVIEERVLISGRPGAGRDP